MSLKQNIPVVAIAVIVAAFISLYPVMDCEEYECPNAVHSALGAAAMACVAGVLSVFSFLSSRVSSRLPSLRSGGVAMRSQTFSSAPFRPPKV